MSSSEVDEYEIKRIMYSTKEKKERIKEVLRICFNNPNLAITYICQSRPNNIGETDVYEKYKHREKNEEK